MGYKWGEGPFNCGTIVIARTISGQIYVGEIVGKETLHTVRAEKGLLDLSLSYVIKVAGHARPADALGWVIERENIKRLDDHEGDGYNGRRYRGAREYDRETAEVGREYEIEDAVRRAK